MATLWFGVEIKTSTATPTRLIALKYWDGDGFCTVLTECSAFQIVSLGYINNLWWVYWFKKEREAISSSCNRFVEYYYSVNGRNNGVDWWFLQSTHLEQ